MKSKGPSTDPCGAPYIIDNLFGLLSFMLMYWDLADRKLWNHLFDKPLIP